MAGAQTAALDLVEMALECPLVGRVVVVTGALDLAPRARPPRRQEWAGRARQGLPLRPAPAGDGGATWGMRRPLYFGLWSAPLLGQRSLEGLCTRLLARRANGDRQQRPLGGLLRRHPAGGPPTHRPPGETRTTAFCCHAGACPRSRSSRRWDAFNLVALIGPGGDRRFLEGQGGGSLPVLVRRGGTTRSAGPFGASAPAPCTSRSGDESHRPGRARRGAFLVGVSPGRRSAAAPLRRSGRDCRRPCSSTLGWCSITCTSA